jgi:hypothetical protein
VTTPTDEHGEVTDAILAIRTLLSDVSLARRMGSAQGEYLLAENVYQQLRGLDPRLKDEIIVALIKPMAERDARAEVREITDWTCRGPEVVQVQTPGMGAS